MSTKLITCRFYAAEWLAIHSLDLGKLRGVFPFLFKLMSV
jgi:hypothetical protein